MEVRCGSDPDIDRRQPDPEMICDKSGSGTRDMTQRHLTINNTYLMATAVWSVITCNGNEATHILDSHT
jgi:hypothetical protein